MKLSIAMATYNGARYLPEQLASFAAQTRLPDELVVTDDGSSDDTLAVLKAFADKAPFPVHIYENAENLGYAQNFARAFALTKGDTIFPSDQDDIWRPNKLAVMIQALENRPGTALILCDTALCDGDMQPNGETKLGRIRANGLPDTAYVMGCCIAMRRAFLDMALPIPSQIRAHDNWLVQMADELGVSARMDEVLQSYRLHGENASDFFINRAERQTALDRVCHKAQRFARKFTSASGMGDEYVMVRALHDHLASQPDVLLTDPFSLQNTIARLADQHRKLGQRLDIRTRPRRRRIAAILSMWRAGDYGDRALNGALRDLMIGKPE